MGYLSNKKHKARVHAFLKIFISIALFGTIFGFGENCFFQSISEYRWQIYLAAFCVFFYTLFHRYYLYVILSLLIVIINYFAISSNVPVVGDSPDGAINLLYGTEVDDPLEIFEQAGTQDADIVAVLDHNLEDFEIETMIPDYYTFSHGISGWKEGFMLTKLPIHSSGRICLDEGIYAEFIKVKKDDIPQIFVAVNFRKIDKKKREAAIKYLSNFIAEQDDPVVVFGNFGMVGWSYDLSSFITRHNLSVKNALSDNLRNIIVPQHFYILAFDKAGLKGNIIFSKINSFSLFTRF